MPTASSQQPVSPPGVGVVHWPKEGVRYCPGLAIAAKVDLIAYETQPGRAGSLAVTICFAVAGAWLSLLGNQEG